MVYLAYNVLRTTTQHTYSTRSSATAEKQRISCPHVFLGWLTWYGQVLIMLSRSALYLMYSASHISAFYQHPSAQVFNMPRGRGRGPFTVYSGLPVFTYQNL